MRSLLPLVCLTANLVHTLPAGAVTIPVVETACATPEHDWRCFGAEAPALLSTTSDQPDQEWTITPILPEDPENWQLIHLAAGFASATFQLVYPLSSTGGGALLSEASFTDSEALTFLTTGLFLAASCGEATSGPYTGKLVCSDGNSLVGQFSFEKGLPSEPEPPSLAGPLAIHVLWTLLGSDVPEASSLNVSGAYFSYVYERNPVPEPATSVLIASGLAALAAWRRPRVRRR